MASQPSPNNAAGRQQRVPPAAITRYNDWVKEEGKRKRASAARRAFSAVKERNFEEVMAATQATGAKFVGEGAYGPVYQCELDGRQVAVKVSASRSDSDIAE